MELRPRKNIVGLVLLCTIAVLATFSIHQALSAGSTASATHSGTVTSGSITISAITVNNGSPIILTANATTTVTVAFAVSGGQGCGNIFFSGGNITSTLYRSGVSSTCAINSPTQSVLSCYYTATTTHNCPSATSSASANVTTTFQVWYFADSTTNTSTASSSYPSDDWRAFVSARSASSTLGSSTAASGVEVYPLLAIDIPTSTMDYGTIIAGANTSSTNQSTTVKNAGNATTTLQVSGNAMSNGSYNMPTSSQHYATSTFTYGGAEQALSSTATTVSGWLLDSLFEPQWRATTTNSLPFTDNAIRFATGVALNGYIYSIGGYSFQDSNDTSTVVFARQNANGDLGAWTSTTPFPSSTAGDAFGYAGRIYVVQSISGVTYYATQNTNGTLGAWISSTSILPDNLYAVNQVYNGYLYNFPNGDNSGARSEVYFAPLSPTGTLGTWTSTAALPTVVCSSFGFLLNGYAYMAGISDAGSCTTGSSTVYYARVNATGSLGAWQAVSDWPGNVNQNWGDVWGNAVYIVGGAADNSDNSITSTVRIGVQGSNGRMLWTAASSTYGSLWSQVRKDSAVVAERGYLYVWGNKGNLSVENREVDYAKLDSQDIYWGLGAPATSTRGTYTSTITYTAVYSP